MIVINNSIENYKEVISVKIFILLHSNFKISICERLVTFFLRFCLICYAYSFILNAHMHLIVTNLADIICKICQNKVHVKIRFLKTNLCVCIYLQQTTVFNLIKL